MPKRAVRGLLHVVLILTALGLAVADPADAQRRGPRRAAVAVPTAADLEVGKFIQVEGRLVDGTVQATQVEFYLVPPDESSFEAVIEAMDPDAGTLTVLGRTVLIVEETEFRDDLKNPIDLSSVSVGRKAKVKGTTGDDGVVTARKIKVSDLDPDETPEDVKIKAPIEELDLAKDTLVVHGARVKIDLDTEYQIND